MLSMQTAMVVVIVALAALLLVRRFYKSVQTKTPSTCGCGCDGCRPDQKQSCPERSALR
ncbi:MAG: FeoB-associated Cys-rich membrane protein [Desulfobacteraceae bacterium]